MKKGKLISLGITAITAFSILHTNALATSSAVGSVVGCNYGFGDINTKPIAEYVSGRLSSSLNFFNVYNTYSPTQSILKGQPVSGRYFLESDVVYLAGHANYAIMSWENCNSSKVGVRKFNTDFSSSTDGYLVGIGQYDLSKVKFAMLEGCETAKGTNNITKYFVDQGATASLGWSTEINTFSAKSWLTNFWDKISQGSTIQQANTYANSKTYLASSIKNTVLYGNTGYILNNLSYSYLNQNKKYYEVEKENNEIRINKKLSNIDYENQIADIIKNRINNNFDINDYEVTISKSDNKTIIDYIYKVNGIIVELGYTAFVENGFITSIFDNTENRNLLELKTEILTISNNLNVNNSDIKLYDYNNKKIINLSENISIDSFGAKEITYTQN